MMLTRIAKLQRHSHCWKRIHHHPSNNIPHARQRQRLAQTQTRSLAGAAQPTYVDVVVDSDSDTEGNTTAGASAPNEPWRDLLEMPARAAWRVTEANPPAALQEARRSILDDATPSRRNKFLLQIVSEMTETHRALAAHRDRERLRAWKNLPYTDHEKKKDASTPLLHYGRDQALAHFKYRLHPNYAITRRVLEEAKSLLGPQSVSIRPRRVLDFGIGCGSASAAAVDVFDGSVEWVHGIDASQTMRQGAKQFLETLWQHKSYQESHHQRRPRVTLSAHLSSSSSTTDDASAEPANTNDNDDDDDHATATSNNNDNHKQQVVTGSGGTFDLTLCCFTANELPQNKAVMAAAAMLWEKLAPNGLFVMIEPGTPDGFSSIRMVRSMLLDCSPPESVRVKKRQEVDDDDDEEEAEEEEEWPDDECHILAPCTHNGECPMERPEKPRSTDATQKPTQFDQDTSGNQSDNDDDDDDDDENDSLDDDSDTENAQEGHTRRGFCSFVQTMPPPPGSHARFRKGEKFSYLVAQKRIAAASQEFDQQQPFAFENVHLSHLLADTMRAAQADDEASRDSNDITSLYGQAQDLAVRYMESDDDELGLEMLVGDKQRASFGRIMLAPKKNKGHILIDTCHNGRMVRHKVTKSMSKAAPGFYSAARKSRWGGLWLGTEATEDTN